MKTLHLLILGLSCTLSPTIAQTIDYQGLGKALRGWEKNRTALYTIDNQTYRTHIPTLTPTSDGGYFVSMKVEHLTKRHVDATGFIELTFAPGNFLGAMQIRGTLADHRIDTGLITRQLPTPLAEGEIPQPDWKSAQTKLTLQLFQKLDQQLTNIEPKENAQPQRRDLWGRLSGGTSGVQASDFAAALRHNLNLLLAHTGHYGPLITK